MRVEQRLRVLPIALAAGREHGRRHRAPRATTPRAPRTALRRVADRDSQRVAQRVRGIGGEEQHAPPAPARRGPRRRRSRPRSCPRRPSRPAGPAAHGRAPATAAIAAGATRARSRGPTARRRERRGSAARRSGCAGATARRAATPRGSSSRAASARTRGPQARDRGRDHRRLRAAAAVAQRAPARGRRRDPVRRSREATVMACASRAAMPSAASSQRERLRQQHPREGRARGIAQEGGEGAPALLELVDDVLGRVAAASAAQARRPARGASRCRSSSTAAIWRSVAGISSRRSVWPVGAVSTTTSSCVARRREAHQLDEPDELVHPGQREAEEAIDVLAVEVRAALGDGAQHARRGAASQRRSARVGVELDRGSAPAADADRARARGRAGRRARRPASARDRWTPTSTRRPRLRRGHRGRGRARGLADAALAPEEAEARAASTAAAGARPARGGGVPAGAAPRRRPPAGSCSSPAKVASTPGHPQLARAGRGRGVALPDLADARQQVGLDLRELLLGDLAQLEPHLRGQQLLAQHACRR